MKREEKNERRKCTKGRGKKHKREVKRGEDIRKVMKREKEKGRRNGESAGKGKGKRRK